MPKATVHKHNRLVTSQHYIGRAWEVPVMEPEAKAELVQN
jgi:hypothetical protein